jgi:hypothetical protein
VPEHWFPKQELDHESFAFAALFGKNEDKGGPRRIGADAWFDRRGGGRAEPEGPTFISFKVARGRLIRLRFVTQDPDRTSGSKIHGLEPVTR